MYNFDDELDKALTEIMNLYGCDDPVEALIRYSKDYEEYVREEIISNGGTEEDVTATLEEEFNEIERGRMIDPEIAATWNRLAVMLEKYPKD